MPRRPAKDDAETEQYRQEAERLALLDKQTQRDLVNMHRNLARDRKRPKRDRDQARQRAAALARLLGIDD
jgi:hypothetical protein